MKNLKKFSRTIRELAFLLGGVVATMTLTIPASADIVARRVTKDVSKLPSAFDGIWIESPEETLSLMAQPMAIPRPKTTTTSAIKVQAIHDGKWIAFRLRWKDPDKSEAGRIGQFSDAVALQFPVKDNKSPPPVFMGAKDNPVHLFHWRAQYQRDKEHGMPQMRDLYPNLNPDIYPMEFKDPGALVHLKDEHKEIFSHGRAAGNPQSFPKKGVDEILAEGYGSSALSDSTESEASGEWKDGEWAVVITRTMKRQTGSVLRPTEGSFMGFAVWQGSHDEVGSRKSVTMIWTPLQIKD